MNSFGEKVVAINLIVITSHKYLVCNQLNLGSVLVMCRTCSLKFDCVLCVEDPVPSSEWPGNTNRKFGLEFIILKKVYSSNAILDSIGFEV